MKKLFTSLSVIVAAMVTFSGCTKEEIKTPVSETKTVQFVAESIETKTAFGTPDGTTYPTLWTTNDEKVEVSMNLLSSKSYDITPSDDFKTARFEAEILDDESGSYTFYSVSPTSANKSFSKDHKSYNLEIPITQTPSATSVDEKAQILVATSETYNEFPNSVNLAYTHFTAYGKMSLTNLNLDGAVVSSVAITANKNIAYRYYYYPETGTFAENDATQTITIMTSSVSDIWFACAPVDMSNSTMEVVVNTNRGTFTREITFPANRKFEAGKISIFSVNMAGISLESPEVYELVTDPAELTEGSKVIIVGDAYAMSTNQKTNNRAATAVTLNSDNNTVSTPGVDVQIFTIEEGEVEGTVAFNTGSGYIYAASSSNNYLKTQTDLTANASWSVTISKGVTSIVAQGTNTRNVLQYNESSSLFACYSSASQKAVSIYKLQGSGTVLENYLKVSEENIEVDADETKASFTVKSDLEWTATSEDVDAAVSVEDNTVTVTFPANEDAEEKVYTVTVSADDVDPVTVTITQAAYVDPTVINEVTITEFLAATVSDVKYKLTGVIEGIYNTTYGNFYLNDGTTKVLVYGLTATEQQSNDKSFASLGLRDGDELTLIGKRADYNGTPQVGGPAYYVSHVAAPYLEVSNKTINVAADATSASFSVDSNLAWTATSEDATVSVSDKTVTVEFLANEAEEKKTYNVTVSADGVDPVTVTVTVTQAAYEDPNAGGGSGTASYTLLFGSNYNSKKISSYIDSWSATNNGFTCTLANWNNNNNGWSYVKAGRKNNASVATITTEDVVPEALTTVTMTVDAVTASKINSLKLYVSTAEDFSTKDTYTATVATGNVVFNITNPVENAYYKIEVDCASGSSNGLITVSKIVYEN